MIAVIGATGNTGRAVVKELRQLGHEPLCIVRNPEKAREVLGADAKTIVAEVTDRGALEKALKGVTSLFVVTGHNPQMADQQNTILDAALQAGTKYLVRVGGGAALVHANSESVVGRGHYAVEDRLRKSGIGWVILRPGLFMQNVMGQAASIKNDSKMVLPFAADLPVALIDVRDTGALGARIVADPAPHVGKTYEFTGTLTNYAALAEVLSQALGRKITYVGVTPAQAMEAMKGRGMPDWLVTHMGTIAKIGAEGAFSTEKTGPIGDIVKRAPITTKQFVADFKGLFA
jgi:uncharacterized protein YbjT (DUF2867 family)